jgi:lipopolysaccharide/colanic/teichoic acid biosynthesis glycosyltransferase
MTAYDGTHPGCGFKPGLTGLVQVNERMRLTLEEKRKYHLYYIKHHSPLLDFEILLKAIFHL